MNERRPQHRRRPRAPGNRPPRRHGATPQENRPSSSRSTHLSARGTILHLLQAFERQHCNLDDLLERSPLMTTMDHRDKRFVFEVVYGIVRRRLSLDYLIDHFLSSAKAEKNEVLRNILRLGMYQLLYLDRVPDHAAVNESVEAAKHHHATRYAASLVNALLHNVIKHRKDLPFPPRDNLVRRFSVEHSHPEWLVQRWLDRYGLSSLRKLLEFNNRKPDIYVRRCLRALSKQQFEIEVRGLCGPASGFLNLYCRLEKAILLDSIHLVQDGKAVIQAPSSGWVVAMLDPQPGDTVVDLCAAPGGKTALAAELAGETGSVVATDLHPRRIGLVRETADRCGIRTIHVARMDARKPALKPHLGRILLDAPCSGTGVLHRHPEARWNRTLDDVLSLSKRQSELLDAAAGLLAPGGILVYATCSLEPEENDGVVDRFLATHPEFSIAPPPRQVPEKLTDLRGCLRILPHEHDLDGMFAVRLTRAST